MNRRLVLLFDGTWNRRESTTNVFRASLVLDRSPEQLIFYTEGIGTDKGTKLRGGALAIGLSTKILGGYLWLMEHYRQDDDVYVLGFSRGAFSARSLVGVLSLVGLLRPDAGATIRQAIAAARGADASREKLSVFRTKFSRELPVKYIGVWDTVAALGPKRSLGVPWLEREAFHKVDLAPTVEKARHALALDENRRLYNAALWHRPLESRQSLEQRWFAGAHANVGGGYDEDSLFIRPLHWLLSEANLTIDWKVTLPTPAFYASTPHSPLDEDAMGAFYLTQWLKPFSRKVCLTDESVQTIDYTVFERLIGNASYRPENLRFLWETLQLKLPGIRTLSNQEILSAFRARLYEHRDRGFRVHPQLEGVTHG